jgi:phosphoribosylformylglycinamidine (FGAM) synthase PurS component
MTDNKKTRKRRPGQTYKYHINAICISVYDPQGQTIPSKVRKELEDSVLQVALDNKLLIGVATT